jgi:hypothetical protein
MSNLTSVSTATDDSFLEYDDEVIGSENIDQIVSDVDSVDNSNVTTQTPYLDARRRLELRLAERNLERDIKEFDFDF